MSIPISSALPEECISLLLRQGVTLATAESCTGGQLAACLTAIPGVSAVYRGGVVSYWTELKASVLGVSQETLERCGAVSEECARAMAEGARTLTGAEYALSTTGVAGPDRDERGNSVGLVFIALATPEKTLCHQLELGSLPRVDIQRLAVKASLELLRQALTGEDG